MKKTKLKRILALLLAATMVAPVQAFAADSPEEPPVIGYTVKNAPGTVRMKPVDGGPEATSSSTSTATGTEGRFELDLRRYGTYTYTIAQEKGDDPYVLYDTTAYKYIVFWGWNDEGTATYLKGSLTVAGDSAKHESAQFTNICLGDLTIENVIDGATEIVNAEGEIETVTNTFTITFTAPENEEYREYFEKRMRELGCTKNADGSYTGTFTLGDGESKSFPKLPAGTGYTVEMTEQPGYDAGSTVEGSVSGAGSAIKGEDYAVTEEKESGTETRIGWQGGEVQSHTADTVKFTVTGGYAVTLVQHSSGDSNPETGWRDSDKFDFVQNFSYLAYVAQGQNLTNKPQNIRVAVAVETTTQGGSTRYLNVEYIDDEYVGDMFRRTEGVETPVARSLATSSQANLLKGNGWIYNPNTHMIVFDAELVAPGEKTKEHVVVASVPAVNSQTDFDGVAKLLPEDSEDELAGSQTVTSQAYAEWLRILVYVGNQNEPEEWQKERDIEFTVRLTKLSAETDPNSVHYMFFASEAAYGAGAGENRQLALEKQADGSYVGTITLKHGQRVVFYDLHMGDSYTVTPALTDQQNTRYAVYSAGTKGTIDKGEDGDSIDMAVFRLIPVHDLTVTKETVGVTDPEKKEYVFDIELDVRDRFEDVNREWLTLDLSSVNFDDIDGEDDVTETAPNTWKGTITLSGAGKNSSVTYTGIPDGSTYKVSETAESAAKHQTKVTVTTQQTITSEKPDANGNVKLPAPITVTLEGVESAGMFNKSNVTVTFENRAMYTLHYDANGGEGKVPEDTTAAPNTTVELEKKPVPTKPGAVWVGWSATKHDKLFTDAAAVESAAITSVYMDGDKTVYAMWAEDANNNGIPDYLEEPTPTPKPTPSGSDGPVKTGDESNLGLWGTLLGVSAVVLCGGGIWFFVIAKKRKKDDEDEEKKEQ